MLLQFLGWNQHNHQDQATPGSRSTAPGSPPEWARPREALAADPSWEHHHRPGIEMLMLTSDYWIIARQILQRIETYAIISTVSVHTHAYIYIYNYIYICVCVCERRTKLLITRNGHGQSGWSPIGCEGLYFHATSICKNRVSVSGWPPIGCECFRMFSHKIEHPMSTPHYFSLPLIVGYSCMCVCGCVCVCSIANLPDHMGLQGPKWVCIL